MGAISAGPRITAVLGPTNTGKTHFAIERMLDHSSGMIGFPLRLLARENYDRVVALRGKGAAALVTGEEKIVPPRPAYFLCTVESMPLERTVDFLAVDEIQLAADPERGHVFTDRLLHARGAVETMFVGADTIRPLLSRLVPEAEFVARPRLSALSYAGPKKLSRLPPRAAVVGFSAADVYALAEQVRRRRGGAAVVLGALSPRTRNAQVAMYQEGAVDYLVATDAIGMGLNLNVRHVAFAGLAKFDGRARRPLTAPEVAQIAGRAGRYLNDGTFGTTAGLGALDPALVEAVENHRFEPIRAVYWRSRDLDFSSPRALLASLDAPPPRRALVRAPEACDRRTLAVLAGDETVTRLARGPAAVRLLWEVCRIPDFRKIMAEVHARLCRRLYVLLMEGEGRLPADWVADQIARLDRTEGGIDTIVGRIEHIRTWTYVSHRPDWLDDAAHWQERTRAIEDRLSDALHERLTQRFVDRRASVLAKRAGADLIGAVTENDEVLVDGEPVGRLAGFRFVAERSETPDEAKAVRTAARRALRRHMGARVDRFTAEPDDAFALTDDARIAWRGAPVARLKAGPAARAPRVEALSGDLLDSRQRARVEARLRAWLEAEIAARLGPLAAAEAAAPAGPARGIVFQLAEALGTLPRRPLRGLIAALAPADRRRLARLGVRLGLESVYMPALLAPAPVRLRAILWAVHQGLPVPPVPHGGAAVAVAEGVPEAFYAACGYRAFAGVAVRADRLEKLALEARKLARQGPFAVTPALLRLAGCGPEALTAVLAGLGYRATGDGGEPPAFVPVRRGRRRQGRRRAAERASSPFAVLRRMVPPKGAGR